MLCPNGIICQAHSFCSQASFYCNTCFVQQFGGSAQCFLKHAKMMLCMRYNALPIRYLGVIHVALAWCLALLYGKGFYRNNHVCMCVVETWHDEVALGCPSCWCLRCRSTSNIYGHHTNCVRHRSSLSLRRKRSSTSGDVHWSNCCNNAVLCESGADLLCHLSQSEVEKGCVFRMTGTSPDPFQCCFVFHNRDFVLVSTCLFQQVLAVCISQRNSGEYGYPDIDHWLFVCQI